MRENIAQQIASYRGYLEWDSFSAYNTEGVWITYPKISIELYIKTATLPIRRPKITEINTIPTTDPMGEFDIRVQAAFFSASDILTSSLSGWMLTPLNGQSWAPTGIDTNGTTVDLSVGNMCYPEIVAALIEGRMQIGAKGSVQRRDPDRYITPYGEQYDGPVIANYDWAFTTNRRKQTFNMTLWLEK